MFLLLLLLLPRPEGLCLLHAPAWLPSGARTPGVRAARKLPLLRMAVESAGMEVLQCGHRADAVHCRELLELN